MGVKGCKCYPDVYNCRGSTGRGMRLRNMLRKESRMQPSIEHVCLQRTMQAQDDLFTLKTQLGQKISCVLCSMTEQNWVGKSMQAEDDVYTLKTESGKNINCVLCSRTEQNWVRNLIFVWLAHEIHTLAKHFHTQHKFCV